MIKGKYLITTDGWFTAPDGKSYRAAWGECATFGDQETLGVKTNARATNWYLQVGSESRHVIIAGCQIHYAVRCEEKPHTGPVEDYTTGTDGIHNFARPTQIYIAE